MKSSKKLNLIKNILFTILILSFLSLTFSQELEEIKIGQTIKGIMSLDEGHRYYKLTIPRNESGRVLIISTHEDSSTSQNTKDSFSDPDIYISKKNKYPSSRSSSEWFSEQYGSDILSIPSESVQENDDFYIGMYCEIKCKYYLKVETGVETEVKLKNYNYLHLKPRETMSYKIKINNDFDKLKVLSYSLTGGKFKIFMNQNSPSSFNSYKVIPSWESGYVILITKDSKEYCNNCDYHVIIHNEMDGEIDEFNHIIFYVSTEEKDSKYDMKPFIKLYDALEENSKECFSFNITKREKEKEKLIIDLVVYSGYAALLIEGWKSKNINTRSEALKAPYSYNIVKEKFILLTKKEFDDFDKEDSYYSDKDSILNFCLYSGKKISYTIQAYYLSSLNNLRIKNILMQGDKLQGYLLKDQVISYELFIDNINKYKNKIETNITVSINKVLGNISSYGYFCQEDNCKLNNKNDIEKLKEQNKLLIPKTGQNPFASTLDIPYEDNYCMKNPLITLNNKNKINCVTYAIIQCEDTNPLNDICVYNIQFTEKDTEIIMKPNQIYYGMIHTGKIDKYRITISDSEIKTLFIVLNSESGDAQLSVFLEDETSYRKESLLSISSHNDYIPDVVMITKDRINKDNLIGKYIVKVYPETFSTYNIYYYVLYNKESNSYNNKIIPEVTMNLNLGLIADYFPNDIRYKIYSFTPIFHQKEGMKIFINRVNINFDIYIYTDISKFEIEPLNKIKTNPEEDHIKGYKYKSNENNEVIIPQNDESFKTNRMIYIVVAPSDPLLLVDNMNENNSEQRSKEDLDKKAVSKFYIGISCENSPLSISEGMPHTMTLSESYSHQIYQRLHTNPKKNLQININVLMGQVDIFASTTYLNEEDIENIDIKKAKYSPQTETYEINKIRFKLNINYFSILELENNFITEDKNTQYGIYVFYYIRRSPSIARDNKACQYILLEKTSETKGQILQPGVVTTGKIEVGKKDYFIVEEIEKRKWAFINVIFKKGIGSLYLRIPEIPESHSNIRFPNEGNYDYRGKRIYSGTIIEIPEKEFKKLNSKNKKLQFLITITADTGSQTAFSSDSENSNNKEIKNEIEYTISYSNEPKRINQNEPYDGYISQGEFQYFNLYFDKSTQNIYIGLTNMNGDADMYLKRGKELPSLEKFDWCSTEAGHEYIDIGKDDYIFKGKKDISGYYTLLIVGFIDTSFSLFVSTHEKKVFPLRNNIPMTCWCENKGEKCFFRYNNVYEKNNEEQGIDHNEIIFTSQYLYGNGFMYSKIFMDSELHNSENFYKYFPDSFQYDYSNKESNQRNYMKVKVSGEKYKKDTSILLTFECSEKTKVDITSTSLKHFSSVDFIRENYENIYYLGINDITNKLSQLTLVFNNLNGKNQDLIYSIHSYIGDAHFKVYGNTSHWDVKTQNLVYDYKLLNEFDLITNDKFQDENIEVYNPYTHDYHNYIPKERKEKFDDIYFFVEPKTEFGFYIQCNFDKNWNRLQIGKSQTFYVVNQELFGYFDINEEYDNMEFSLTVEQNLRMYAELYIKINIIDKNLITQLKKNPEKRNDEFSLYHYSIPTQTNYDYTGVTDKTLGTLSLNLNKLPKLSLEEIEKGNKIIRGLFYVLLYYKPFTPIEEVTSSDSIKTIPNYPIQNENENQNSESSSDIHTTVNIVLTPGINNFKYVDLKPYEYYFSNKTYNISKNKPVETKVYSLTKENPNHDIMVIEISTCVGNYELNIQENLIGKDNFENKSIPYTETNDNGKKVIYITELNSKHYYLSIKTKGNPFFCKLDDVNKENCGINLQYLIYYYTTYTEFVSLNLIDKWISFAPYGKGKARIDLPAKIVKDLEDKQKEIKDYKFDVFGTKNKDYLNKLGNICFLSRLTPEQSEIFKLESLSIENKNSLIISDLEPGNRYYLNVLAQNTKTKELITFQPIEIFSGGRPHWFWRHIIRNIFILCIILILIYYIYKYRKARDELVFLRGEAVTKTESEFAGYNSLRYGSEGVKYTNLGSGY